MEEQTPQEPKSNKTVITVIVSVIITALVIGGGVYAMQQAQIKKITEKDSLQMQQLQAQLTQLQNQIKNGDKIDDEDDGKVDNEINFSETGTFTKDFPGSKPGVLYLLYEKPGAPALTVELEYDGDSKCANCDFNDLKVGDKIQVDGLRQGDVVTVDIIELKTTETEGITVTNPMPNEVVKLPITVNGSINGNGWFGNEGEVGNVQVFDANGKVVSNVEVLRATTSWLELPTSFEAVVGDREMMSYLETDTGYILFKSIGVKDDETQKEFRVPIRFE